MAAFLAAHLSKPVQSLFEVWCDSAKAAWFEVVLLVLFSNFSAAKITFYAACCVYLVHMIHD